MIGHWRDAMARHAAAQLAEPRGLWGRVMGTVMNSVNADMNEQSIALLALESHEHVLEIGFGGGKTLPMLLQRVSAGRVTGMERSETMLAAARASHVPELRAGRLALVAGDASTLPWSDATFDKVLTVNTLYFWESPVGVLTEIRRVLRSTGSLVLAYRPQSHMERLPVSSHGFRIYSDEAIVEMLHDAGFEVVAMKFDGRHGHAHTCVVARPW
ncbi:class I SAM-dependent methyltransferase [Gemmatimonas phototrophica]|uniref:Methyltransferase type 11 domain-containing protein n=1 Tax=Gemmatimonas phototrophica TaxID=1379270 RepID=A0A143BP13_9BACT|nr:class I SAM-dependent methyltransferase [Gemmatimonas phototrophica]AMW06184.1 hypothetical protein GEMMAAP_18125 [Gemmatimonas phototrophica]